MTAVPLSNHAFRVEDDLWQRARALAQDRDESLSEVLRRALAAYVSGEEDTTEPAGPADLTAQLEAAADRIAAKDRLAGYHVRICARHIAGIVGGTGRNDLSADLVELATHANTASWLVSRG